jgi:hypothetical protein
MLVSLAGNMPTSESAAQAKPVQVVQQDDVGFGCIFRTVRVDLGAARDGYHCAKQCDGMTRT